MSDARQVLADRIHALVERVLRPARAARPRRAAAAPARALLRRRRGQRGDRLAADHAHHHGREGAPLRDDVGRVPRRRPRDHGELRLVGQPGGGGRAGQPRVPRPPAPGRRGHRPGGGVVHDLLPARERGAGAGAGRRRPRDLHDRSRRGRARHRAAHAGADAGAPARQLLRHAGAGRAGAPATGCTSWRTPARPTARASRAARSAPSASWGPSASTSRTTSARSRAAWSSPTTTWSPTWPACCAPTAGRATSRRSPPSRTRRIDERFLFVNLGYNFRATEVQGAFGIHQVPKLEAVHHASAARTSRT